MELIVATVVGLVLALAFLGFMAASAASIPLWVITLGGMALMVYGMVKDFREGAKRSEDSNGS